MRANSWIPATHKPGLRMQGTPRHYGSKLLDLRRALARPLNAVDCLNPMRTNYGISARAVYDFIGGS